MIQEKDGNLLIWLCANADAAVNNEALQKTAMSVTMGEYYR
jgi:hypothetical protein